MTHLLLPAASADLDGQRRRAPRPQALSMSRRSPLVRLAEMYERALGRLGDAHLCVTDAMVRPDRKSVV